MSYQVQDAEGTITRVNGDCLKKYWREDEDVLVETRIPSSDDTGDEVSDPILHAEEARCNQETDSNEPDPLPSLPNPESSHETHLTNTSTETSDPTTLSSSSPNPSSFPPQLSTTPHASSDSSPSPTDPSPSFSEPQETNKDSTESPTTQSDSLSQSQRRRSARIQAKAPSPSPRKPDVLTKPPTAKSGTPGPSRQEDKKNAITRSFSPTRRNSRKSTPERRSKRIKCRSSYSNTSLPPLLRPPSIFGRIACALSGGEGNGIYRRHSTIASFFGQLYRLKATLNSMAFSKFFTKLSILFNDSLFLSTYLSSL